MGGRFGIAQLPRGPIDRFNFFSIFSSHQWTLSFLNCKMQNVQITPSRTVVTSFRPKGRSASTTQVEDCSFEEGDWVLCVAASPSTQWVSCALSNEEIQVYDKEKMMQVQTYHSESFVTDLAVDYSNSNILVSSAADGTVTLFDIRQQHPAFQTKLVRPEEEALSLSLAFEGKVTAVGSNKGKIHFFDIRNRNLLGTYNNAHTKEITKVRFQSVASFGHSLVSTPTLLTASEDGFACIFDTTQPSEETALQNVLSVQSPIREIGFFGSQSEAIYCLTGDETLKLFHKDNSACQKDFGLQLRPYLTNKLPPGPSVTSSIEYLVDCHWDHSRQELLLLAGSVNGDSGLYQVAEQDISLVSHLCGGHRGVIRSWIPMTANIFVTVGEDARMCEWNRLTRQVQTGRKATEIIISSSRKNTGMAPKTGGGKVRRPRSRLTQRPY